MAWNGSGVFSRIYNWVNDRDAAIPITASRADGEDDNFATGIQACLAKNGENSPTANLPMGTYRHTGVGNASARTDYAAAGQVQDGAFIYAADTGSANTYAIAPSPAITAYAAGQTFRVKITNANTGASTLNVSGLGAKTITNPDGAALVSGQLAASGIYTFTYDGTNFQIAQDKDIAGNADTVTTITTSQVLTATASATALSVGSYTFARITSGIDINPDGLTGGSFLRPTSAAYSVDISTSGALTFGTPGALSGTWKCMGYLDHTVSSTPGTLLGATLWLRIS